MIDVAAHLEKRALLLEPHLEKALLNSPDVPPKLREAMQHCLLGVGKRLRPNLVLAAGRMVGGDERHALPGALAVEMIHTYSLVHDDLPCMDDDDLRRGRPTVHSLWGNAIGVLTGDALQALAFETLLQGPAPHDRRVEAARVLARAAGGGGMVGGQVLDLEAEGASPDLDLVGSIHRLKTAALIAASCEIGGILGAAQPHECEALGTYGRALGLAFQIVDDCLDETATAEELGKGVGKDRDRGKVTWPACVGIEASREEAVRLAGVAVAALRPFQGMDLDTALLQDVASFVIERKL